jgi:hypothetical protein
MRNTKVQKVKKGDRVTFTVTPKGKDAKPYSCVGVVQEVKECNFGALGRSLGVKIEVLTKKWKQSHTNKTVVKMVGNVKKIAK